MSTNFAVPGNNVSTTIAATTTGSGLPGTPYTITLAGVGAFPTLTGSQYYRVTVCQVAYAYSPTATASNYTIYKADTLDTVNNKITLRSVLEGTTDRVYNVGDVVEIRVTAGTLSDIQSAINTLETSGNSNITQLVATGGTAGTPAVSPATLTSASTTSGQASVLLVNGTDVYAGNSTSGIAWVLMGNATANRQLMFCDSAQVNSASYYGFRFIVGGLGGSGGGLPLLGGVTTSGSAAGNFGMGGASSLIAVGNLPNTNQSLPQAHLHVWNGATTRVPVIIVGIASQTADLQQWQNSSGTVLSGVGPAGHHYMVTQSSGGTPSGTPPAGSLVFDTSNNKLWAYNGTAWKSTTLA